MTSKKYSIPRLKPSRNAQFAAKKLESIAIMEDEFVPAVVPSSGELCRANTMRFSSASKERIALLICKPGEVVNFADSRNASLQE